VLFAGPGRAALDYGRSWWRRPLLSGFIFLVIAAGATVTILYVFR
jgi:putative oxidoreductase